MHETLECPDCDGVLELKRDSAGRLAYLCTTDGCRGRHSAHQGTGLPMGRPADARVRGLRREAHEVFDRLWKSGKMKRGEAYAWMRKAMGLSSESGHISMFSAEQCRHLEREMRSS